MNCCCCCRVRWKLNLSFALVLYFWATNCISDHAVRFQSENSTSSQFWDWAIPWRSFFTGSYGLKQKNEHIPQPDSLSYESKEENGRYRLAWCPDVRCRNPSVPNNYSEPDLCRQKWLFILSTGRSGSTSILETLNAISWPVSNVTVRLRGEHAGAMTDLVNYVADLFPLRFTVNDKESNESSGQSHNAYFRLFMMQHIQRLFEDIDAPPPAAFARLASNRRMGTSKRYLAPSAASRRSSSPGNTVLGFKEIRYNYESHVHFLKTVFPCSRIIFNHRLDTKAQSKSAFYKKDRNAVIALEAKKKGLEYLSQLYPASSVLLPLEALNPGNFTALLRWLGFQNCTVRRLCHSNSNKTRFGYSNSPCNTAGMVQGTCGLDLDKQALMNT